MTPVISANELLFSPSPLRGGVRGGGKTITLPPSSGATRHLLPQGEKEGFASFFPSPLVGEGAERSEAGEGVNH